MAASPRRRIRSFLRPKDTDQCGEASIPKVVIDVVIFGRDDVREK
jgi:hypothetical protein